MGRKYRIYGFNYPYGHSEYFKQCRTAVTFLLWLTVFSMKYDGVDVNIRRASGRAK